MWATGLYSRAIFPEAQECPWEYAGMTEMRPAVNFSGLGKKDQNCVGGVFTIWSIT